MVSDILDVDPLLGALADNGGPTLTHALLLGSDAIDGGSATGTPTTDQRGYSRDGSIDIGAYEYNANAPNSAPTGTVVISGTATEDQTLNAFNTLADADGMGTVGYQWQRDGVDIAGATGSSYALTDADVGTNITVVASYTDGASNAESVTSSSVGPVANVNDAPTITSDGAGPTATINVAENQTAVTTVSASDADLDTLTYSISGGTDSSLFSIDTNTGVLTFTSAPDYESPTDANTDGVYEVEVTAADGNGGTDMQIISVTVTDVVDETLNIIVPGAQSTNEDTALVFSSSNGNQISISVDAAEVLDVTLSVTNGTLTLSGTSGLTFSSGDGSADASLTFSGTATDINTALNGMTFDPSANYNGSATLSITTGGGTSDLDIDVALEGHYTFDDTGALGTDDSGSGNTGTVVGATAYNDPERGDVLSLVGNDYIQIAGQFGNPADVTLATWVNLTSRDTYGAEAISLGDNVVLRIDDHIHGLYAVFYDGSSWNQVTFNTSLAGTGWHHVAVTFDDTANTARLYLDGSEVASSTIFTSINYSIGSDTFIGKHGDGQTEFDFNGDIDDARIYTRALSGSEIAELAADTSISSDSDSVAITVSAVNDAPTITSDGGNTTASVNAEENQTAVSTVTSTDIEGDTITYSISGGADAALFSIDANTGVLTFNATQDFETFADDNNDGVYEVQVTANDGIGDTDVQDISVTVTDVNETPTLISLSNSSVDENTDTSSGHSVGSLTTTDEDSGDSASYSIVGGADSAVFSIGGTGSNELILSDGVLDRETQASYQVVVRTTDSGGLTHDETLTITVNDLNEPPGFTSYPVVSATEDSAYSYSITTSDPDSGAILAITAQTLPTWLSLSDNGDGTATLTGTPTNSEVGDHSVVLQVSDGTLSAIHSFTITVANTNDAPVIGGQSSSTLTEDVDPDADTLLEASGNLTITDPDAGESSFQSATINGTYGDLTIDSAGNWSYSADNIQAALQQLDVGEIVNDVLTVTTADGTAHAITITISGAEDAPVITGTTTRSVAEDGTLTTNGTLSIADTDTSDNPISFPDQASTLGDHGYGNFELTGSTWTYTLNNGHASVQVLDVVETLTDTYNFAASDGSIQTVTIIINGAEDTPVITGTTTGSVMEDGTLTANGTLSVSDTDSSDNPISFPDESSTLGDNGYGSFTLTGGTWTYTVNNAHAAVQVLDTGETLTDTHTFTASDGSTQQVAVTINGAEDAPVIDSTAVTTATEDSVYRYDILVSDDDGDTLGITASTLPAWLTFVDNGDGTATLSGTPGDAEVGDHSVVLRVSDGTNNDTQSFIIRVANVNDTPVANPDNYETNEDTPLAGMAITANDRDVDGAALTIISATADHGSVSVNVDYTINYIPDPDFNGMDTISYQIEDEGGGIGNGIVTVNVNAIEDAFPDYARVEEDGSLSINVLTNDIFSSDVILIWISRPQHGSVDFTSDGTITYTPIADYYGEDVFTYTVTTTGNQPEGSVINIIIEPVRDTSDDQVTTDQGTEAIINPLNNDGFNGETTITNISQPTQGTATLLPDGQVNYSPDESFIGKDFFDYTVTDTHGHNEKGTIEINVNPINTVIPDQQPAQLEPETQQNQQTVLQQPKVTSPLNALIENDVMGGTILTRTNHIGTLIDDLLSSAQTDIPDASNFGVGNNDQTHSESTAKAEKKLSLVELMQLQAYQDQISNMNLLSENGDAELDIQTETALWKKMDEMDRQMKDDLSDKENSKIEVQLMLGSSVGLTVGFVNWILRAGSLLSGMLSSLPVLYRFDPLPILKKQTDKQSNADARGKTEVKHDAISEKVDDLFSGSGTTNHKSEDVNNDT